MLKNIKLSKFQEICFPRSTNNERAAQKVYYVEGSRDLQNGAKRNKTSGKGSVVAALSFTVHQG